MSFWGATVITNMVSAVPYVGTDLVQWIWGGFEIIADPLNYVQLKILFIARKSSKNLEYWNLLSWFQVIISRRKLAGVHKYNYATLQRLNTKDFTPAMLVGLIEGDGWLSVTKKNQYLTYELGIEMNKRDTQLLYKIKNYLGVGTIKIKTNRRGDNTKGDLVTYRIRNKSHLINIIIPTFN